MIKAPEIIHISKKPIKEVVMEKEDIVDIPMPIVETRETPSGSFPVLASKLQEGLGTYLNRQKAAVEKVLYVTREKTEFLEAMADKTEEDLKNEKRVISRSLGNI
jgi:hypothetical protein